MEKTLYEYALNIKEPWKIEKINFDSSKHRLDIWINFKKGFLRIYLTVKNEILDIYSTPK
jgi:hypothetical protein